MPDETRISTRDAIDLPAEIVVRQKLDEVAAFQKLIHATLIRDHDYGIIPGTAKPTLFKAGAEKTTKLLGLADTYVILEKVQDWDKPLFAYEIKCQLVSIATGVVVAEGLGECNSYEAKYRWRQGVRTCPECQQEGSIIKGKREFGGGWLCWQKKEGCGAKWPDGAKVIESQIVERIPNPDIYDQVNTLLKMAKKRALVDAALSVGRLSDLFTQDMEDAPKTPDSPAVTTKPKTVMSQNTPTTSPESPAAPPEQAAGTETPTDKLAALSQEEFIVQCKQQRWDLETVNTLRTRTGFTDTPSSGDYTATYDAISREWEMMQ
jgi:hypothetical protein